MSHNRLSRANYEHRGEGRDNAYCLFMEVCGIGDNIHAMPSVVALIESGIDVTLYCRDFVKTFWQLTGANVHTIARFDGSTHRRCRETGEFINLNWLPNNIKKYGRFMTLDSWSNWETNELGYSPMNMLELYASLVHVDLPQSFSWLDYLKPQREQRTLDYIVYAPESTEGWRSLPPQKSFELYAALKEEFDNVVWVYSKPEYGEAKRLKTKYDTHEAFADAMYHASCVISVESGTLNLAAAVETPVVGLHGVTEPGHTIEAFRRYLPDMRAAHIFGAAAEDPICKLPCYRHPARGMKDYLCCGHKREPECMKNISVAEIVDATKQVLNQFVVIQPYQLINSKEIELCQ